jgi:hypothetical protein
MFPLLLMLMLPSSFRDFILNLMPNSNRLVTGAREDHAFLVKRGAESRFLDMIDMSTNHALDSHPLSLTDYFLRAVFA